MNAPIKIERPTLIMRDGEVRANSREVAERFGKNHRDVLRSIDRLVEDRPDQLRNFAQMITPTPVGKGAVRRFRSFDLTRDGFVLLVMGFTGKEALDWKIRFLDAFNEMERQLRRASPVALPAPVTASLPEYDSSRLYASTAVVREARKLYGPAAARAIWSKLGLPEPPKPPRFPAPEEDPITETLRRAFLGAYTIEWVRLDMAADRAGRGRGYSVLARIVRALRSMGYTAVTETDADGRRSRAFWLRRR